MHPLQDAYQDLANAIIVQAVEDYRKALNGISYNSHPPEEIVNEIERFFRSEYYRALTKVNGEYLIQQIRKEELGEEIYESIFSTIDT